MKEERKTGERKAEEVRKGRGSKGKKIKEEREDRRITKIELPRS